MFKDDYVANLPLRAPPEKLWKSVKIWRNYGIQEQNSDTFWLAVYGIFIVLSSGSNGDDDDDVMMMMMMMAVIRGRIQDSPKVHGRRWRAQSTSL